MAVTVKKILSKDFNKQLPFFEAKRFKNKNHASQMQDLTLDNAFN